MSYQEILIQNFEQLARFILGFGLFFISLLYVTVIQKSWKKTPFFTVGFARTLLYYNSWGILITSPLGLLLLSPELPASQFYYLIAFPYLVFVGLMILVASFESFFYLPAIIMRIGGMDYKDARVRKGVAEINRFVKRR